MNRIIQNTPPEPADSGDLQRSLSVYSQGLISLDGFLAYWKVSRQELSVITGAPIGTVKKWFCRSIDDRLYPSFEHRYRLTITHRRWVQMLRAGVGSELG